MRSIGQLEGEDAARTFGDFLYVEGIKNQVEPGAGNRWDVWIYEEDHLVRASELLDEFRNNPAQERFRQKAEKAEDVREREERELREYQKKVHGRGEVLQRSLRWGMGPLTLALLCISVGVYLLMNVDGPWRTLPNWMFLSMREVLRGEVWRVFTPMFLHFHILHILFNMWWLKDLGGLIESRMGTRYLAIVVFTISAVSNLTQYQFSGPYFGGMSGVVYGLLGYIWIRGKYDPRSGLFLHPSTVMFMMVWLMLGVSGMIPRVANAAHISGLLMGVAWGYLASRPYR